MDIEIELEQLISIVDESVKESLQENPALSEDQAQDLKDKIMLKVRKRLKAHNKR